MKVEWCLICALLAVAMPDRGYSQDGGYWGQIGWGGFFNNDLFGDGRDRWRTGSYGVSFVFGPRWQGRLPERAGEVVELRFAAEVIAPARLSRQDPDDRRYAGVFSVGLHTHFETAGVELALGADLAVTGPQTALGLFQTVTHSVFPSAEPQVLGSQIGNGVHPTFTGEAGRVLGADGAGARVRPFLQTVAGLETLVRAGADVTFGGIGEAAVMARDTTSGHRYPVVPDDDGRGVSVVAGFDVAHVVDSRLLPGNHRSTRTRFRVGAFHEAEGGWLFFGLTWLGREFSGQPEGQIVASISGNLRF